MPIRAAARLAGVALLTVAGCRSPEAWKGNADEAAARELARGQRAAFGATNAFDVVRPADVLRDRLHLLEPAAATPTSAVTVFTLRDCLEIGARNSPTYQDEKESVFTAALDVDLQRHAFENSYSGLLKGLFKGDESTDPETREVSGSFGAGLTRTFKNGATLAAKLSFDVVQLLTGDKASSHGVIADATMTLPLLQGSGEEIVTEPLTQAERSLMYALWQFERFRKQLAVDITRNYMNVLQSLEETRNAQDNGDRLLKNLARAESMAQAGRTSEVDVDQTRQDLLRASNRFVVASLRVERDLDTFKVALGLPVLNRFRLDEKEMEAMTAALQARLADPAGIVGPDEMALVRLALDRRFDLRVVRGELEDAKRKVAVAKDALRTGLDVTVSGSTGQSQTSDPEKNDRQISDALVNAGAELDLPWERTTERNAYRQSLLALDAAQRAVEQKEDDVALSVREAIRSLKEAVESYQIQQVAVRLAERRVQSTVLFLEAGRAQNRDVLEAEEALVSARNALSQALVSVRLARLNLLKDTEQLEIDSKGTWIEKQP